MDNNCCRHLVLGAVTVASYAVPVVSLDAVPMAKTLFDDARAVIDSGPWCTSHKKHECALREAPCFQRGNVGEGGDQRGAAILCFPRTASATLRRVRFVGSVSCGGLSTIGRGPRRRHKLRAGTLCTGCRGTGAEENVDMAGDFWKASSPLLSSVSFLLVSSDSADGPV